MAGEAYKITRTESDADATLFAALCSKEVYKPHPVPKLGGFDFQLRADIPASWNGNIKATSFTSARRIEGRESDVFVIAVKGTDNYVEGMICLACEPMEATRFFVSHYIKTLRRGSHRSY